MATELEPPAAGAVQGAAPLEAEEDEEHWLYGGRYRRDTLMAPGPSAGGPPGCRLSEGCGRLPRGLPRVNPFISSPLAP